MMMLNLIAALLLISWLWPVTRTGWDFIDVSIFTVCNNSLKTGKAWQTFWAITNWRLFDLTQFVLVFGILCFFVDFIFSIALSAFDYQRPSPTKVVHGAVRLSKTIIWLITKDSSIASFPGDHGFVLICASVFFWLKGGFRIGIVSSLLFAPFLFPRLIVGAHWATDILVGSVAMSLITIGWYFGSPLQHNLPLGLAKKLEENFPTASFFSKRNCK